MLKRSGVWQVTGLASPRLDRAEIRARIPDVDRWVLDELLDIFEPAATAAIREGSEARRKREERGRKPPKAEA